MSRLFLCSLFFFFNDTATTEIYTLSLHDALPICDRATVHVCLGAIEPQLPLDGEVLRRERLVHLDEIHLLQFHSRLLERFARGGRGADPHVPGLDTRHRPSDEPAERLQAV